MTINEAILLTALLFVSIYCAFMIITAAISDRILDKLVEMEEEKNRPLSFNEYLDEKLHKDYEPDVL
jgi:hypothetical protein